MKRNVEIKLQQQDTIQHMHLYLVICLHMERLNTIWDCNSIKEKEREKKNILSFTKQSWPGVVSGFQFYQKLKTGHSHSQEKYIKCQKLKNINGINQYCTTTGMNTGYVHIHCGTKMASHLKSTRSHSLKDFSQQLSSVTLIFRFSPLKQDSGHVFRGSSLVMILL